MRSSGHDTKLQTHAMHPMRKTKKHKTGGTNTNVTRPRALLFPSEPTPTISQSIATASVRLENQLSTITLSKIESKKLKTNYINKIV